MRNILGTIGLCLALATTAGAAGQGGTGQGMDRLEPGQMTADQIRIVLQARGYSELGTMDRDGDTVSIAEAKRYGEAVGPLRLDAKTGKVRDEKPLTDAQAQALLRDRGFSEIRDTGRDGDAILATAQQGGMRVNLRVDARSGTVSSQR